MSEQIEWKCIICGDKAITMIGVVMHPIIGPCEKQLPYCETCAKIFEFCLVALWKAQGSQTRAPGFDYFHKKEIERGHSCKCH